MTYISSNNSVLVLEMGFILAQIVGFVMAGPKFFLQNVIAFTALSVCNIMDLMKMEDIIKLSKNNLILHLISLSVMLLKNPGIFLLMAYVLTVITINS